ncbi:MAG: Rho termination factor N-terminal domain-containing protein [Phycisphaeraceae bacterium]|nr:Rho termination factor N-terminal domain-containing protein [Phycisphaeraceae bacterium]
MTPRAWSNKDERQYNHIRRNQIQRGRSEDLAEEIAGRTVNKQRRKEGRTPQSRTQGTGNPNKELPERTRNELYNLARDLDISGRSHMNKKDLISAIRRKRK